MEKILERSLLFDFYGELLTERQRKGYSEEVFDDLSLSEAAEEENISRQGVYDMVRRCDKALSEYERKLGLVKRFMATREKAAEIRPLTEEFFRDSDPEHIRKIAKITYQIEEL